MLLYLNGVICKQIINKIVDPVVSVAAARDWEAVEILVQLHEQFEQIC